MIGSWRREHTGDGAKGMPAHVTLLYPFATVEDVDPAALEGVFEGVEPFGYSLRELRDWPDGVVYLDLEPAEPFVRLTESLCERFPDYPPYGGAHETIVPHVTVVHEADELVRADAVASVARSLPIACNASEAWLMHEVNGQWQRHTPLPLGR